MSNCTCGRTTRAPLCDGSHALTDEQYAERSARLAEFQRDREIRITNTGVAEQQREGYWQPIAHGGK